MCPQFVDFNADGHFDLVMGTFEGVTYLVPGTGDDYTKGLAYRDAVRVKDEKGDPILISAFWNFDAKKWDHAEHHAPDDEGTKDHQISAVAVDWDGDADLDLLLGSKEGRLYLRVNEGKADAPKYSRHHRKIRIGSKDSLVPGGLTAPRVVDWNADGLFDLVCGSFTGGVYLYLNRGTATEPEFDEETVLVSSGGERGLVPTHEGEPLRPGRGCYVDAVDYDQDGDLDLIVGGYSRWETPPSPDMTPEDLQNLADWDAELATVDAAFSKFLADAKAATKGKSTEEGQKIYNEMFANAEFKKLQARRMELTNLIRPLRPEPFQEKAFVWLYRRN
ncbi:MAG: VCBS repeat-containing protein [Planctomycetota bacterium]